VRLSASLLPAVLLFFVVAEHFDGTRDTRRLYLTFSAVGLGLASVLLWTAWRNGGVEPSGLVSDVGSPILLVPNDGTFLAVVAPLSLAVLSREHRGAVGVLTALSVLLSVCAVGILQSRVATLTMVASTTCAATLVWPRLGPACGLVILILVLLIDGFLGFPLVAKFSLILNMRIPLWLAAWAMFLDAPLLGHGPHTFVLLYRSYLRDLSLPTWLQVDTRVVPWAHNLYLEVLAEQGIVGLVALGFLLVCGAVTAWKIQRTALGEARIFAAGALAGLVGLCGAAVFELSLLRQWVVIMIFTLLGVIAQLSSSQTAIPKVD
jgi:O-antigen ligase